MKAPETAALRIPATQCRHWLGSNFKAWQRFEEPKQLGWNPNFEQHKTESTYYSAESQRHTARPALPAQTAPPRRTVPTLRTLQPPPSCTGPSCCICRSVLSSWGIRPALHLKRSVSTSHSRSVLRRTKGTSLWTGVAF